MKKLTAIDCAARYEIFEDLANAMNIGTDYPDHGTQFPFMQSFLEKQAQSWFNKAVKLGWDKNPLQPN